MLTLPWLPFVFIARRKRSLIFKRRAELKELHRGESVFRCDTVDDLGENLIQFYGIESMGSTAALNHSAYKAREGKEILFFSDKLKGVGAYKDPVKLEFA